MSKSSITAKEALLKMQRFCAYQERCQSEVLSKLKTFFLTEEDNFYIIHKLIEDDFVNEERFAKLFARSKHNQKFWGKIKISSELKKREIPKALIEQALAEIDKDTYIKNFFLLAQSKAKTFMEPDEFKNKAKIYSFLNAKGYENELIQNFISELK